MKTLLVTISPFNPLTGQRVTVNVGDGPSPESYGIGGTAWQPAMVKRPAMSMDLFSPDMDGTVEVGTCSLTIGMRNIKQPVGAASLYYSGAPITIYSTDNYDLSTATLEFIGNITDAKLDTDTLNLEIDAAVSTTLIEQPLLTTAFDGSLEIGGDAALRGTLYPAGFGKCTTIQPIWFDTVNNIGMIDGYQNTLSIDGMYEGLSSMGPRQGDYATYNDLLNAILNKTVQPGQWATCVASGLVGLGAPQTGVITVNATFGGNRPGALMQAWMLRAGVPSANIDTVGLAALDALCPYPVHYWTATQVQVKDLLTQMCASVNASPVVSFQGKVTVTRAVLKSAADLTLDRNSNVSPLVQTWGYVDTDPPYYLIKARAGRPASVLTTSQVNYVDDVVDMGTYDAATIYQSGNLVWLPNGSSYLYINATPAAGQALPTTSPYSNSYWQQLQTPTAYADGTPLENLKPAQLGADQTAVHTAAAIAGQGPGATAVAGQVINSYTPALDASNRVRLSMYEKGSAGWAIVTLTPGVSAYFVQGTQAGIPYLDVQATTTASGQIASLGNNPSNYRFAAQPGERLAIQAGFQALGPVASRQAVIYYYDSSQNQLQYIGQSTQSGTAPYNTPIQFFDTVPANAVSARLEFLATSSGSGTMNLALTHAMVSSASLNQSTFPAFTAGPNAQDGADPTAANTSAAVNGQGSLATQNYADWLSQINGQGKPANYADVTSQNTAAGFTNQGALATKSNVGGTDMTYGSMGATSIWDNEPNATTNDPNNWKSFCQLELTPLYGAPVVGTLSFRLAASSAAVTCQFRVRRDDGTIIKGGNSGAGINYGATTGGIGVTLNWIDTVAQGRDTTWYVEAKIADGTTNAVLLEGGCGWVQEISRSAYQHATITTASGTGPGAGSGGGGSVNGSGGGFGCPWEDEYILAANDVQDGPGEWIRAGDVRSGMMLWTRHEKRDVWGAYPITYRGSIDDELWEAEGLPITSPSHIWITDVGMVTMAEIGQGTGRHGKVIALHVRDARTYVLRRPDGSWALSHNKTVSQSYS